MKTFLILMSNSFRLASHADHIGKKANYTRSSPTGHFCWFDMKVKGLADLRNTYDALTGLDGSKQKKTRPSCVKNKKKGMVAMVAYPVDSKNACFDLFAGLDLGLLLGMAMKSSLA